MIWHSSLLVLTFCSFSGTFAKPSPLPLFWRWHSSRLSSSPSTWPHWEILLSVSCLWLTNRYSPLQIIPVCSNPEYLSAYASFPLKCPTGTYNKACSNLNSPTNLPFIVLSINERYHHTLSSRGRKLLCLLFLLHSPLPQLYPTSMSCKLSLPNISRIPLLRSTHREVPAMAILN